MFRVKLYETIQDSCVSGSKKITFEDVMSWYLEDQCLFILLKGGSNRVLKLKDGNYIEADKVE